MLEGKKLRAKMLFKVIKSVNTKKTCLLDIESQIFKTL